MSLPRNMLILLLFVASCNVDPGNKRLNQEKDDNKSKIEEVQIIPEIKNIEPRKPTKYLYVVIETDEPKLVTRTDRIKTEPIISPSEGGVIPPKIEPGIDETIFRKEAISQFFTYTSDIITIEEYDEDKRYMEIDNYEKIVSRSVELANQRIAVQNHSLLGDLIDAEAKIISRNSFVFDSYKDASTYREKRLHK